MAPLTLQEAYRDILAASVQSPVVMGIESLLLEEPVLKLRVYVEFSTFIAETDKTSFALIRDGHRSFGADITREWHLHPFSNPESHSPCEVMSFANFLR